MNRPAAPAVFVLLMSVVLAAASAACGSGEDPSDAAGGNDGATPRPATVTAPRVTPVATGSATGDGDTSVSATPLPPGVQPPPPSTPATRPTPSFPTKVDLAPIDDTELIIRESFPPQYALRVVSGLPSGCHQFDGTTVARNGAGISVTITNLAPDDAGIACTAVYGQHEQTVELGADFISGTVYTVTVNGDPANALEFTAQ